MHKKSARTNSLERIDFNRKNNNFLCGIFLFKTQLIFHTVFLQEIHFLTKFLTCFFKIIATSNNK